ncbi:hypothetical protein DFJ74DRAFT_670517 [Hyaloraphidium curvatum]|nr:hypothetical protein DFJ74DRAFT_670517 [Hyaloraphidium curvatum]
MVVRVPRLRGLLVLRLGVPLACDVVASFLFSAAIVSRFTTHVSAPCNVALLLALILHRPPQPPVNGPHGRLDLVIVVAVLLHLPPRTPPCLATLLLAFLLRRPPPAPPDARILVDVRILGPLSPVLAIRLRLHGIEIAILLVLVLALLLLLLLLPVAIIALPVRNPHLPPRPPPCPVRHRLRGRERRRRVRRVELRELPPRTLEELDRVLRADRRVAQLDVVQARLGVRPVVVELARNRAHPRLLPGLIQLLLDLPRHLVLPTPRVVSVQLHQPVPAQVLPLRRRRGLGGVLLLCVRAHGDERGAGVGGPEGGELGAGSEDELGGMRLGDGVARGLGVRGRRGARRRPAPKINHQLCALSPPKSKTHLAAFHSRANSCSLRVVLPSRNFLATPGGTRAGSSSPPHACSASPRTSLSAGISLTRWLDSCGASTSEPEAEGGMPAEPSLP